MRNGWKTGSAGYAAKNPLRRTARPKMILFNSVPELMLKNNGHFIWVTALQALIHFNAVRLRAKSDVKMTFPGQAIFLNNASAPRTTVRSESSTRSFHS